MAGGRLRSGRVSAPEREGEWAVWGLCRVIIWLGADCVWGGGVFLGGLMLIVDTLQRGSYFGFWVQ